MPEDIKFDGIIEPLSDLFKDEVRRVGELLGIPKELVWRQPFPGPGLGVRIIGEITKEKIRVLQEADAVFRDEIKKSGIENELSQYFAVLPDIRTVGVMGDHRTYDHLIAIRAVTTDDFMTADFARIPYDVLARVSSRIINEVDNVNRVVYDITSKPPGTVEWE
jgi:GMP synthase (glutamine-hydrolysing)